MIAELPVVPTIPPRTPHTLIGGAEPCCLPGLCDYRPDMVAAYMAVIRRARADGEDLTASAAEARGSDGLGRSPGVSPSLDIRFLRRVWDIERAQREGARTVEDVSRKLCPFSLDDA